MTQIKIYFFLHELFASLRMHEKKLYINPMFVNVLRAPTFGECSDVDSLWNFNLQQSNRCNRYHTLGTTLWEYLKCMFV